MSANDFAHVGVLAIAITGFTLGTGFFGMLIALDDLDNMPLASWLVGIFVYGLTVMFMWKG